MRPEVGATPWSAMDPAEKERFGEDIFDPATRACWCGAVALGGLPYMWMHKARIPQKIALDQLETLSPDERAVRDAAGLLQPNRRGLDRLMCPALRRKSDPGRRADQNRLAAGIDSVGPRLKRALDERVVEHSDGEKWLTPTTPGGASSPISPKD